MAVLRDLYEKKGKIVAEQRSMLNETPSDQWTGEHETRYNAASESLKALQVEIEAAEATARFHSERARQLDEIEQAARESRNCGNPRQLPTERAVNASREDRSAVIVQAWLRAGEGRELTEEHRSACRENGINPECKEFDLTLRTQYGAPAWACGGNNTVRELRAGLDVGTSGAGQETIPRGFLAELDRKMLAFAGPRAVARVIRTATGNALPMPKVDDTSNTGELLAEATSVGTSVDPTFSAVTLNAYKYSSKAVLVSSELLNDSAFDMASEVSSLLAERLGRKTGADYTTADGSSKPTGIVTGSVAGKTAASTTAFTADELKDLVASIDPAYRVTNCGFMLHDTVLTYISKWKDSNGQYLWQPGLTVGSPDRLLGYPVSINQNMSATFTTGQKLVLFGDFSKFYIRDVASIRFRRLDERYADTDQVGFFAFLRTDSNVIQSAAIKHLKLA